MISSDDSKFRKDLTLQDESKYKVPSWASFNDLGLADPLVATCKSLGFTKPTPVQRTIIPFLLQEEESHVLALAATGSGKTASFVLPILHRLALDPYGIYAVIVTPTRELAKQIHQQVLALGSCYRAQSVLVIGGLDMVRQSCELDSKPHFVVATLEDWQSCYEGRIHLGCRMFGMWCWMKPTVCLRPKADLKRTWRNFCCKHLYE